MTELTNSQRLRLKIRLANGRVRELSHRFWEHPRLPDLFPEYLTTLYSSMCTTVPMLEAAEARCRELAEVDPVAAQLVPYFEQHAREEAHHDDWLLEDMETIGMDPAAVRTTLPSPDVAAMIGTQYYWLWHTHPVTVLGCFAVLEGDPPEVETLDQIAETSGLPKSVLRTLYKHAHLDPHHRDDLDEVVDALPLQPEHIALMGVSALTTVQYLGDILERLLIAADGIEAGEGEAGEGSESPKELVS